MKKTFILLTALLGLTFSSCSEPDEITINNNLNDDESSIIGTKTYSRIVDNELVILLAVFYDHQSTMENLPIEDCRVLSYQIWFQPNQTGDWVLYEVPPSFFALTESQSSHTNSYGNYRMVSLKTQNFLQNLQNQQGIMLNSSTLRQIKVKLEYKIQGKWKESVPESFNQNSSCEPFCG